MTTERSHMNLDEIGRGLDLEDDSDMQSILSRLFRQVARQHATAVMDHVSTRLNILDKERTFLKGKHLEDIKAVAIVATEYLGIADMFSKIATIDGMEKTEEETNKFINRFKEIMVLIVSYGYVLARDEHEVQ